MGLLGTIAKGAGGIISGAGNFFSGAVDTIGDFIPGIGDAKAQEKANELNMKESALNRQFQQKMSNTAYQRAMQDMKKAGLNPTLAYMQGGASTPSGGMATASAASKTGLADYALKATTGLGSLSQQQSGLQQQAAMNESAIQLNATSAAKNVADAQRTTAETKGLGRKEGEGKLWSRFYKGIENVLDSSAKATQERNKPLIKKLGPASKAQENSMFKFLRGPQGKP